MVVSKIQDRNPCTKKGRGGRWSKIGMTSGEIWTVEESIEKQLISRIVKIIKIGREKFLRQKKSLRANQIKEDYFPI